MNSENETTEELEASIMAEKIAIMEIKIFDDLDESGDEVLIAVRDYIQLVIDGKVSSEMADFTIQAVQNAANCQFMDRNKSWNRIIIESVNTRARGLINEI